MSKSSDRSVDGRRRAAFTAIAIILPLVVLCGAEIALRALDAAPREPLFIENPQLPAYSLANPRVVQRLFASPAAAPAVSIETGFFQTKKSEGALRLVVQGGSSAAGFPYGYSASLAGMLEQRLGREFPERQIEVVTTAMSAINSYALLDFADEIIAIEPDAILIYAGHNEFLGILGVGSALSSSQSPWLTRLILQLRRFVLYRVIERTIAPDRDFSQVGSESDGTLMARIAAEKRIPLDSRLFQRGVEQFRVNLDALLRRYADAGVPVFVATLVSNERDQAPFASSGDDRPQRNMALEQGWRHLESGEAGAARDAAEALVAADPGDAGAWYLLASVLSQTGDAGAAADAFRRARDLDQLRFRAPSPFNDVIHEVAGRNGATVVEVEDAFRNAARDGVVGSESMLEHLHPNVDGYFLLASEFHRALIAAGLPGAAARAVADEVARAEVPVSGVDEWFGRYKVTNLMNHWPFTDEPVETVLPRPRSFEQELARDLYERRIDWTQAHRRLLDWYHSRGDGRNHLRVALVLADAFPFSPRDQYAAGVALMAAGRHLQAVRYLLRADRFRRLDRQILLALGKASLAAGLKDIAAESLAKAQSLAPDDSEIRELLDQARR